MWRDSEFWSHLIFIWLVASFGIALAIALLYPGDMRPIAGWLALIGEQVTAGGLGYLYAGRRWRLKTGVHDRGFPVVVPEVPSEAGE